jgi:hypothetical protein
VDSKKTLVYQLNWRVALGYGHGGYHYNPHVSKPVALEPIGEEGGYHYFGPPPDGGFSYGLFSDGESTIASKMSPEVFNPLDGKPLKFLGPVSFEDVKKALSGSKFANLLHSCNSCAQSYVTSSDHLQNCHCPSCGTQSEYGSALMRGRKNRG